MASPPAQDSAWGIKPGMAWAEEVEAEEARHGPRLASEEAFPSLDEAVKAVPGKSKKAKPQKMSIAAFQAAGSRSRQLSDKELLQQLPKGSSGLPKEEREGGALGGAFRDYGGNRDGFGSRRDGERDEREPSRADSSSSWGGDRKFTPSEGRSGGGGGGGFGSGGYRDGGRDREGGFGDRPPREERPISEADVVDDWGANRKFTPSAGDAGGRGGGGGGGGFGGGNFKDRDGGGERRGGFGGEGEPSRAETGDWGTRRAPPPGPADGPGAARRGYGFADQPPSAADAEDKWSHKAPPPGEGPSSSGPPAERPRLKLAPRTLPLPDLPPPQPSAVQPHSQQQAAAATANGVGPSPAGSEAGSSSSSAPAAADPKPPRVRSNPFGAARPREEVLKEKGIDYHKEELKLDHGEVLRDTTPEEDEAIKEVEALRKGLEELTTSSPDETDTIADAKKELDEKERALYTLQAKLDDEVKYSKRKPAAERDGGHRGSSNSSAAEDMSGFEPVRNPRKERAGAAAAAGGAEGSPAAPSAAAAAAAAPGGGGGSSGGKEQEGGGGAWGRGGGGGGNFRDRDGPRGGGRGDGPRGDGPRGAGRGDGPPGGAREKRANESLAGRTGGGW